MPFIIKTATLKNASLLTQMGAETFTDTYAAYNTPEDMEAYVSANFSLQKMQEELADSINTFLIIYAEQIPVGYIKLSRSAQPAKLVSHNSIEINRLYIVKAWQHKNAGTALMQHCIQLSQAQGYETIWVDVWQQNPGAIAFYKKWGFKIFDTKIFVLGNDRQDDFLMKKDL